MNNFFRKIFKYGSTDLTIEQINLAEKPKGVSLDEVLLCADLPLDKISKLLDVTFEYSVEQGGPIEDCLIRIGNKSWVYIHKWQFEAENDTRFNTEILPSDELNEIKSQIIKLLNLDNESITWVNPKTDTEGAK